jgi:cell division protein FtsB
MYRYRPPSRFSMRGKWLPGLLAGFFCYFLFHMLYDDRGLFSLITLHDQMEERNAALAELRSEREGLEHKVARLRPDALDVDLLEEQARNTLNATRANEVIVMLPEPGKQNP